MCGILTSNIREDVYFRLYETGLLSFRDMIAGCGNYQNLLEWMKLSGFFKLVESSIRTNPYPEKLRKPQ
jgi:hypothetical protein